MARARVASSGFTLIEMMAVVVIMGLVVSVVAVNVMDRMDWARVQTTKLRMRAVETSLEMFRFDHQEFPDTGQGLGALVERPSNTKGYYPAAGYVRDPEALNDGWQRPLGYESPGSYSRVGYDLWSYGQDGRPGGDDTDRDLTNW